MSALPQCPYATPNDDDLTGVVTHLTPRLTRAGSVPRDANEPEVRWLLEAGLRALDETVLSAPARSSEHLAYVNSSGFFDTLPLERVMSCFRAMCTEHGIDPGSANKARLIRRWSFAANYQLDLVAYLFRPAALTHRCDTLANTIRAAFATSSIGELVDIFGGTDEAFPIHSAQYRLQHMLRIMFPADPTIVGYSDRLGEIESKRWAALYEDSYVAYGLKPIGYTTEDMAALIRAASEGVLLLAPAGDPRPRLADGTDTVVAAIRSVLTTVLGLPWEEIAHRRALPVQAPPVEPPPAPVVPQAVPAPGRVTPATGEGLQPA